MQTINLNVTGMHCSSCSMLVTMNLDDLAGVQSVDCNHATGKTVVVFDPTQTTVAQIVEAIAQSGYAAELVA